MLLIEIMYNKKIKCLLINWDLIYWFVSLISYLFVKVCRYILPHKETFDIAKRVHTGDNDNAYSKTCNLRNASGLSKLSAKYSFSLIVFFYFIYKIKTNRAKSDQERVIDEFVK